MIHPDTELRWVNEVIGLGVFAKRPIPRGTLTWVRDELDLTMAPAEYSAIPELLRPTIDRYAYWSGDQRILCWDSARYMNHSCEPTCLGTYEFDLAIRDLAPGDELTGDYATFMGPFAGSFTCACGQPGCRRHLLPDDAPRLADHWDSLYLPAFARIASVPQALLPLVRERAEIARGLADPAAVRTHRQVYLEGIDRASPFGKQTQAGFDS